MCSSRQCQCKSSVKGLYPQSKFLLYKPLAGETWAVQMTTGMATLLSIENWSIVRCAVRVRTAVSRKDAEILIQMVPVTSVGKTMEQPTTKCHEQERDWLLRPEIVLKTLWADGLDQLYSNTYLSLEVQGSVNVSRTHEAY